MIIIETCPICGHDLIDTAIAVYPPIPQKMCLNCGWHWEGEPEKVVRVPFGGNSYASDRTNYIETHFVPMQPSDAAYNSSACKYCSNNPSNGGSGICHCILGQRTFY
jgi:hypothetical protein